MIWDTAGQERFRTLTRSYFRNSHGIIACYDISNEDSFYHLINWLDDARKYSPEKATVMVLGTKRDKDFENKRQVPYLQATNYAQENDSLLFETSSLTGENIENAFNKLTETILNKH
jgi:Ras-related protein Rab-4B